MRKVFRLVIPVGLVLLTAVLLACGTGAAEPISTGLPLGVTPAEFEGGGRLQGISVSGEGRAAGVPDVAILTMGVSSRAVTLGEAHALAQDAMNKLFKSLRDNGIQDQDIRTQQFNISPEFGRPLPPGNEARITGYRVTNTVQVKVRKIEEAGKVIDDAVAAVGDLLRVHGIHLTIDDPKSLEGQAREKAVADAQAKAEQLARSSSVGLGKPVRITESIVGGRPIPLPRALGPAIPEAAPTPISPGELEVAVVVQMVFAIR